MAQYGNGEIVFWNNVQNSYVFRIVGTEDLHDGSTHYRVDVLAKAGKGSGDLAVKQGETDVAGPQVTALDRAYDSQRVRM